MLRNSIYIITVIILSIAFKTANAQSDSRKTRKLTREGNEAYSKKDFKTSEEKYQMALSESDNYFNAKYNLANSFFKQKRYDEAAREYEELLPNSPNNKIKAHIYHNLGNCKLVQKKKDIDGAIEAYENSLKIDPKANDTRYNLSYAMELKKQQQKNKNNKKQNKNDKNKQKQDKQKQDKQKQDKQKQDKQKQDKQKQDQEKKNQDKKDKQQKDKKQQQQKDKDKKGDKKDQQPQGEKKDEKKMSKKDTERILKAMAEKEKETKEKLQKKTVKVKAVKVEKDW